MNTVSQIVVSVGISILLLSSATQAYGNTNLSHLLRGSYILQQDTLIDEVIDTLKVTPTPVVAIQSNRVEEQLKLFPNPTSVGFTIQSTDVIEIVYVYGTTGQLIQSLFPQTQSIQVDLSNLPTGMYVVKCFMESQDRAINRKVLKQ